MHDHLYGNRRFVGNFNRLEIVKLDLKCGCLSEIQQVLPDIGKSVFPPYARKSTFFKIACIKQNLVFNLALKTDLWMHSQHFVQSFPMALASYCSNLQAPALQASQPAMSCSYFLRSKFEGLHKSRALEIYFDDQATRILFYTCWKSSLSLQVFSLESQDYTEGSDWKLFSLYCVWLLIIYVVAIGYKCPYRQHNITKFSNHYILNPKTRSFGNNWKDMKPAAARIYISQN